MILTILAPIAIEAMPAPQAVPGESPPCRWRTEARPGTPKKPVPCGTVQQWLSIETNFPKEARERVSGKTVFRLDVSADGAVTDCTIVASNVDPVFGGRMCQLMREHARFQPALDAEARPVAGSYTNAVRWAGENPPPPLASWSRSARFEIDAEGILQRCEIRDEAGTPRNEVFLCEVPRELVVMPLGGEHRAAGSGRTLVRRISYLVDGAAGLPAADVPPRATLFARRMVEFDVDADGKIGRCDVVAEEGPSISFYRCAPELRFTRAPGAAPATVRRAETLWVLADDASQRQAD